MNEKFDFGPEEDGKIVYVRPVAVTDLPQEVQDAAGGVEAAGGRQTLFAVHDADGQRLALVKDRKLAFVLARQNDLAPVNVH